MIYIFLYEFLLVDRIICMHEYVSVCLSVCGSGLRDIIAYSLVGGGVPYPEHRLNWSLDSDPMFKVLCFPSVMVCSLPFPPSKIQPVSLFFSTSCPSPLSFRPNFLLSARFCIFSRPPPASGHSSSVCRKSTNPPAAVRPMSSPGFLSSVPYVGLRPPPPDM